MKEGSSTVVMTTSTSRPRPSLAKAAPRRTYAREFVKAMLAPLLRWRPLTTPAPGFTIILGVPWDLRHLLPVNLQFVARTNVDELRELQVIFDRTPRSGAEALIWRCRSEYPQLPLTFRFHDRLTGWIVNRVHASKFYNSMNTVLGLRECTTRYAVLHDFDLYPLVPTHFTDILDGLRRRHLRFCALERTHFDGLTDDDNILGTWALGIDAQWLRATWRPVDCFHRVTIVNGRAIDLDPYSFVQTLTPERDVVSPLNRAACCHVQNLCSTYLRVKAGLRPHVVWRLHYLWYLEYLCGESSLSLATSAMRTASSARLKVGNAAAEFSDVHVTCANVLRDELGRMEIALFGQCRPEVAEYVDTFERYLQRFGNTRSLTSGLLRKSRQRRGA
jgi:hypothetical protein